MRAQQPQVFTNKIIGCVRSLLGTQPVESVILARRVCVEEFNLSEPFFSFVVFGCVSNNVGHCRSACEYLFTSRDQRHPRCSLLLLHFAVQPPTPYLLLFQLLTLGWVVRAAWRLSLFHPKTTRSTHPPSPNAVSI